MRRNHPLARERLDIGSMGPGIIPKLHPRKGGLRWLRVGGCAALGAALLTPGTASARDTASAQVQAAILTPGSVAKIADMNFGSILQSTSAGTIVMSAQAAATCTPTGTLLRSGTCKAAAFTIRGKRAEKVRIKENNGGVVTLNGPAGATMTMDTMTIGFSGMTATNGANGWDFGNYKITDPSGITTFYIGGTLHVGAAQAPGVYNGTLIIQIQFN